MAEVKSNALGLVLLVVVFGGGITALVLSARNGKRDRKLLADVLFDPYFAAIRDGRIDEAWQGFTTDHYKSQYSKDRYRQHYEEIMRKDGAFRRYEIREATRVYETFTKKSGWAVTMRIEFENGPETVRYALYREGDSVRIDRASTYTSLNNPGITTPW